MPRTKKPVSENQLAANRANAARSTGPRSPEGKARSAQNSRKHGFTSAAFAVVVLEQIDEVAHLREDAIAVYQQVNSQELFAIERIALAQQALLRAERLHSGMFTNCLNQVLTSEDRPTVGISPLLCNENNQIVKLQNRNFLLAEGFNRIVKSSLTWPTFLRYQAQAERLYRRAIEEFERLKRLRPELPNEPILDLQPEANETTCPNGETNPSVPPKPARPPRPPEHYGPDGEFRFPYDLSYPPAPSGPPDEPPQSPSNEAAGRQVT